MTREGIEPPTRGFSVFFRGFEGFINQSLTASCRPLPRLTKAQSWHTQSELVTFVAQPLPASPDHSIAAAQAFFRKALSMSLPRWPRKITLDGHKQSHLALRLLRRADPKWKYVQVS